MTKKLGWVAWGIFGALLFLIQLSIPTSVVQGRLLANESIAQERIVVFGRDDCGFCRQLFTFLNSEEVPFTYLNITNDSDANRLFLELTEQHSLTRVTPITVVGDKFFVGFNSPRTTGKQIVDYAVELEKQGVPIIPISESINGDVQMVLNGGSCSDISCDTDALQSPLLFDLPILGVVDLKTFSLFTLSVILGIIDGFNPCAMWVLVTFLALLAQAGSRKKMIFLAGIFIIAQGAMYNLILNVWYKTWDFVALDEIVTPFVGVIALGGGLFFLWRWYKNRQVQLVCDITSIDSQMRTVDKFKKIVNQPITIASVAAIFVIAFSVNIIEFACSIGIPQAYTKILEMNMLSFIERQWYIFVFTLAYMFDDVVVFGIAIWGYGKLQAHGQKYAHLSLLIGGTLMIILGALLVFYPNALVL
jgi:glutaredoxin